MFPLHFCLFSFQYKLLLYVGKQQQVTFGRVTSAFTFTVSTLIHTSNSPFVADDFVVSFICSAFSLSTRCNQTIMPISMTMPAILGPLCSIQNRTLSSLPSRWVHIPLTSQPLESSKQTENFMFMFTDCPVQSEHIV